MTLKHTHSTTATTSSTITNSIKGGLKLGVKVGLPFVEEGTAELSVEYEHRWDQTSTRTESDTEEYSTTVPVTVPAGKKYKVILIATVQKVEVSYTVTIAVSGKSETWFENRVQGRYSWSISAEGILDWISRYGTAGDESPLYRALGSGQGGVTFSGTLTAERATKFQTQVLDITGLPAVGPLPLPGS